MFSNANKKILAVADGEVLPLSRVPDEVFASGMLGEGFAVQPTAGTIYSPVNGTIGSVTETKHAYTVRSSDGLDILVHIGVDTVKLCGEGFISLVEEGDEVKAGDIIARADLDIIKKHGCPVVIPVIVSNFEEMKSFEVKTGAVRGGKSAAMTYKKA
jgi:glucose-specific phosphotransferase system IIA component